MTTTTIPEDLHPALWLASQLTRSHCRCVDTWHPTLTAQLSHGG